jgi:hypothetical protein
MRSILTCLFCLVSSFFICNSVFAQNPYCPPAFDTTNTVVLPFVVIVGSVPANCKRDEINDSEVTIIDSLLAGVMFDERIGENGPFPEQQVKKPRPIKEILSYYKRQFVCYRNDKEEKIIWIYCFCASEKTLHWKEYFVSAMDGGDCFFNLKLNLTNKTAFDVKVNGFPSKP